MSDRRFSDTAGRAVLENLPPISVISGGLRAAERARLQEIEFGQAQPMKVASIVSGQASSVQKAESGKGNEHTLVKKRVDNKSGEGLCSFYQDFVSKLDESFADDDEADSDRYAQRLRDEYQEKAERFCA